MQRTETSEAILQLERELNNRISSKSKSNEEWINAQDKRILSNHTKIHVRGVFPDYSAEYVDVDMYKTSVGVLKDMLCNKKRGYNGDMLVLLYDNSHFHPDSLLFDIGLKQDCVVYIVNVNTLNSQSTLNEKASENTSIGVKHAKKSYHEEGDFYKLLSDIRTDASDLNVPSAMLTGYQSILQRKIENSSIDTGHVVWKEERDTWLLLDYLTTDGTPSNLDRVDSEFDALLAIDDEELIRNRIVLRWLEGIAKDRVVSNRRKVSMRFRTVKVLNRNVNVGKEMVTELDPDGPFRQGKQLQVNDFEDEMDLLRIVWEYIRCGQLEEAKQVCVQFGQPWRAASLSGGEVCGGGVVKEDGFTKWGNPFRSLWKRMCWKLSERNTLDETKYAMYERAVYAALSGNVKRLLESPLCNRWDDQCWVYFKSAVEVKEEQVMYEYSQKKWSTTKHRSGPGNDYYFEMHLKNIQGYPNSSKDIFDQLLKSNLLNIRTDAERFFHIVQAYAVTADAECMVREVLWQHLCVPLVENSEMNWELNKLVSSYADQDVRYLRFAAHVVLYYKESCQEYDTMIGSMIIKHYIEHLLSSGQYPFIPYYASQLLPIGSTNVYAQVLQHITDINERKTMIDIGLQYFDESSMSSIVKMAVQNTITTELPNDGDRLEAIKMLCFKPSDYGEALLQSNILMRHFMQHENDTAGCTLFQKILPNGLISTLDPSTFKNPIREHLMWEAYVMYHVSYLEWRHCISKIAQLHHITPHENQRITNELASTTSNLSTAALSMLCFENGFLRLDHFDTKTLRSTILPKAVTTLHRVYYETSHLLYKLNPQSNLPKPLLLQCDHLVKIVCSNQYSLLNSFRPNEAAHFINQLRLSKLSLYRLNR